MILDPNRQGPGEHTGTDQLPLEGGLQHVPEGEMLIPAAPPAPAVFPAAEREQRRYTRSDGQDRIRSTSTDQDALPVIRLNDSTAETRADGSLGDLQRETALDPVHDDLGPHTDRS